MPRFAAALSLPRAHASQPRMPVFWRGVCVCVCLISCWTSLAEIERRMPSGERDESAVDDDTLHVDDSPIAPPGVRRLTHVEAPQLLEVSQCGT
jgi:hypothetical protein